MNENQLQKLLEDVGCIWKSVDNLPIIKKIVVETKESLGGLSEQFKIPKAENEDLLVGRDV